MSTTPTNYELDTAPVETSEVYETAAPAVEAPVEETAPAPKTSSPVWSKIGAIFFAILALIPFVLPIGVITTGAKNGYVVGESMNFLSVLGATFANGACLAPFAANRLLGIVYNLVLYATIIIGIMAVVFAVISVIKKDGAPKLVKVSATLVTLAFACYAIAYVVLLSYWEKLSGIERLDLVTTAITFVSFICYTVLCGKKAGKNVWANLLHFVITLVYTAMIALALVASSSATMKFFKATDYRTVVIVLVAVVLVNLLIAYLAMSGKKTKVLNLVRAIVMTIVAAAFFIIATISQLDYVAKMQSFSIYALLVAVVAVVASILPLLKKKEKVVEEEPVPELIEVTEAVAYEGGPIPVEMAEEVEPVEEEPAPELPPVETADYDYYNSRAFDPFIASLNAEERNQFTQIFILNYKGTLEGLPEYQVGGDNKEFFRAIFVNLGMYRDRIPDGLLEKIYKFTIRL